MSGLIVVGIDGSEESRVALDRAIDETRLRGGVLQPVLAWTPPRGPGPMGYVAMDQERAQHEAAARTVMEKVVAEIPSDIEVDPVVVAGLASQVLLERSEHADLLVVGTRGRGGFAGLLLGSTSHQVTSHARCPVLVVPSGTKASRQ